VTNLDEISVLLTSMKKMEADMNAQVTALFDAKVVIKETEEKASTMEALAVKDSLTGIGNRRAYEEEARKVNVEIAEGLREFGIAMIDLNYLKIINDTYGHERGDIAIKMLSSVTCDVFKRSRVFRVGGDEFVVLLKTGDYLSVEKRIKEFDERILSLREDELRKPWERISAAIGYAIFNENTDKTVDDVFQKADKAMYDRKAAMKAERNP
jgi:diguanylate cyclase (GGDEF)-like protein